MRERIPLRLAGRVLAALGTILYTQAPVSGQTTVGVDDASVVEGNSGTTTARITVRLSGPSATPVTVAYGAPTAPDTGERYMGINVGSALDWEGNLVFADAMKSARTFRTPDDSANAAVDAVGWPTEDFGVVVWHGISRLNGTYALSFNGRASVDAGYGDVSLSAIAYDAPSNTSTASLTYESTDGAGLQLTFTATRRTNSSATNTGVTNIRLMRPTTRGASTSYPRTKVFSDQFGNVLRMFKGARFMDFTATNGKLAEDTWSKRALPTRPSQAFEQESGYGWQGKGSAWEFVILMANEFDVDAWICVPVAADNDYVTKLARLFKYGSDGVNPYTSTQANPVWPPLENGRVLYIEYANELWNTAPAFEQAQWNHDRAVQEAAAEDILDYDGETNDWYLAWRRTGKRTVEISERFRAVFGDAAMMTTVRPLILWQQGDSGTVPGSPAINAFLPLDFIEGYYNNGNGNHVATPHPVSYYVYGGSGSAYYGPNNDSDSLTLANIWNSDTFDTANWVAPQAADVSLAAAFGLKRTAYEGGPGMDAYGHSESVKEQAWNDPRMRTEIVEHQQFWEAYGGDALFYFYFGGDDSGDYFQWSMVRNIHDPIATSPKLQGIADLMPGERAQATFGTLVPATLDGDNWSIISQVWGTPGSGAITLTAGSELRWAAYTFRTTTSGARRVVVTTSGSGTLDVYLDDVEVDHITVSGSGSHTSSALEVPADTHGVRVRCTAGSVDVGSVRLE